MQRGSSSIKKAIVASGLTIAAGLVFSVQAVAGCSDGTSRPAKHLSTPFLAAVYHADHGGDASLIRVAEDEDSQDHWSHHSIVGLWEFEFRLDDGGDGGKGTLFDWGLATWHEDGTEIQFSGARAPASGDVCMGVWRREGESFKLNHIALGLTPPTAAGAFTGPTRIQATVTLDRAGTKFKGPETFSLYSGTTEDGPEFDTSGKPYQVFKGTVTATRVTVDE